MARFQGRIKGNRGGASRLGSAASGLTVIANGWTSGVEIQTEATDDGDEFHIYATSGSSHKGLRQYIGKVRHKKNSVTFLPSGNFS